MTWCTSPICSTILRSNSPFKALQFRDFSEYQVFSCQDPRYNIASNSICRLDPTMYPEQRDSLRDAEGFALETQSRRGWSHFGPKFKFNPIRQWQNLSWQQTFYIPLQKRVDGQWVSFTQFFYDRPVGSHFQLFSEISLWTTVAPDFKVFPAAKLFFSYFPTRRLTLYTMTSVPVEYGLGTKYQLSRQLEVELLYTHYLPVAGLLGDVRPSTFNLGFRFRR